MAPDAARLAGALPTNARLKSPACELDQGAEATSMQRAQELPSSVIGMPRLYVSLRRQKSTATQLCFRHPRASARDLRQREGQPFLAHLGCAHRPPMPVPTQK